MANGTKPVLLADSNQKRSQWLQELLEREFAVETVRVTCFYDLLTLVLESLDVKAPSGLTDYSVIFIADDLPKVPKQIGTPEIVKGHFRTLEDISKVDKFFTVLIVSGGTPVDFRMVIPPRREIRIHAKRPSKTQYKKCSDTLNHFGGLERITSAKLSWDKNNRILREQIRALSDHRDLAEGERCLAELIGRCLDCNGLKPIEIHQLGQGKSGAGVFQIRVHRGAGKYDDFLLKLCRAEAVWKLQHEVRGSLEAAPHLAHPEYLVHLPIVQRVHVPDGSLGTVKRPNEHIVRSGRWQAIYFDFLGDKFGSFIDLETALVESADELEKKAVNTRFSINKLGDTKQQRIQIFGTLLDWLCDNWYANSRGHLEREEKQIWNSNNSVDEQSYPPMPPYQLTHRSKGWIQSFLDGSEAGLGERFFPDWAEHVNKVLRLVTVDEVSSAELGQLGQPLPVIMTHVHGDLNASNILLWLDKNHPFLIDFPFYQEAGHALQDFARLEVEIKLGLVDRQKDSSDELKAFEYTYTQMPIWKEMEDRLLDDWTQVPTNWPAGTYEENVSFCFALIQLLRTKAQQVQANTECSGLPATDFLTEYFPALLFHTVRAIGFPSLSVFKRLLAVYSSGLILKKLNVFSETHSIGTRS